MPTKEETPLKEGSELYLLSETFPLPLSFSWRSLHFLFYITGGTTFFVGSYQYFPSVTNYELGGWLFTIGSVGFFCADGLEWWTNNRVGCFYYSNFENSYEKQFGHIFEDKDTTWGKYQRAENGINFFASLLGSTLYLIGSIMFIPSLDAIVGGTWLFIWGSLIIFLSQSWKIWRAGCSNPQSTSSKTFLLGNLLHDLPATLVDSFAGLGGLSYLVGSIYFLPQYDVSTKITTIAAWWFILGGAFYTVSGLCIFYRYFFTLNYPHEDHSSNL